MASFRRCRLRNSAGISWRINLLLLPLLCSAIFNSCEARPVAISLSNWFNQPKGSKLYDSKSEKLLGFAYYDSSNTEQTDKLSALFLPQQDIDFEKTQKRKAEDGISVISLLQKGNSGSEISDDRATYRKCLVTLKKSAFKKLLPKMVYVELTSSLPIYESPALPTFEESLKHRKFLETINVSLGEGGHLVMSYPYQTIWRDLHDQLKLTCIPTTEEFPEDVEDAHWEKWGIKNMPSSNKGKLRSP
ncbi:hypothetical protein C8R42DRAFT_660021 [Lentinula raphanica]|nr:hypothetical protein C8R42DRAFT_660021 [Lentinula raphanica]